MARLSHILTATDLSSSSLHAVDRGFMLAQATGARYTVAHALGVDALAPLRELFGANNAAITRKIVDEAREELSGILAQPERNRGISAASDSKKVRPPRRFPPSPTLTKPTCCCWAPMAPAFCNAYCSVPPLPDCCAKADARFWWSSKPHMTAIDVS
jgi:hypothetical protein